MTDITERLRELSKARWDKDAWERETTVRIPAEPDRDIDLVLANAAAEIERLRARVAELEATRGEPVAYLHQVVCGDGEPDQALSFAPDNFPLAGVLGYRSLSHVPLYTAPRVDVDAISDEALNAGWEIV